MAMINKPMEFARQYLWLSSAAIFFALDQFIKIMLVEGFWLEKNIFGWLAIDLSFNNGMAFSLGSGGGLIISLIGIIIFLYFLLVLYKQWSDDWRSNLGVGLVWAGALSNLVDRLKYNGSVVDYVNVSFYSVFNLADIVIVIGLLMIAVVYWKNNR